MTDIRSTDFAITGYRESRGKNVVRGVLVAIVLGLATGTRPDTNVERKTLNNEPTTVARFAAREEAVDLQKDAAVPLGLVRQEREQHAPCGIGNNAGKLVVLEHPQHVQILDDDHLVFANESSRELVQMIASPVGNAGMKSSELLLSLVSISGSFLFVGKTSREQSFASSFLFIMTRVGDLLAGRESSESCDADVDAHGGLEFREWTDALVFAKQRDVPAPCRIQRDRYGRWFYPFGEWSAPTNIEWCRHFCQRQHSVFEAKSASAELGGSATALLLEARILCSFREEVGIRTLKMPQRLLKRYARHLIEKGEIRQLLPRGEGSALGDIADRFLRRRPRLRARVQRLVVDETNATESTMQESFLLGRRVEAVTKASKHIHKLARFRVSTTQTRLLPALKDGVSAPEIR